MICAHCRHENRAGAKFCEECGAPLPRSCTRCGEALPALAKFCPECAHPTGVVGAPRAATTSTASAPAPPMPERRVPSHLAEKILTSKSAIEGERKQVTVLFADLKGSMELLAERDPEVARQLLDPALELMMDAVHRYEGTVNQVMGDGIMALFGAPLAHEDHAVRACYAALHMQAAAQAYAEEVRRTQGVPIRLRVGLNSGEVLVRTIGSDLHMDYTAVGQTTHLAARMEQLADPGSTLLAPATWALAEGFVKVRPLGPTAVKGLAAPVEIYELAGASEVRGRLQASVARGLTRFVGRDAEQQRLHEALLRAGEGRGQVVAIAGEPGVGKSRLSWEFSHSSACGGWLVLQAAAVSYGRATTYGPVIELLRSYFGIESRDDARRACEKVTGRLLSLERGLEPTLPVFLSLLNLPLDDAEWDRLVPLERKRRTLDALKRLLLLESRVQPVLLVFEDLQWIDSETQAFLDLLVESLSGARLLLVANFRPDYQHGWAGKRAFQLIRLDTLEAATSEEFLNALLGHDASMAPLKPRLIRRTEGNPFFLEETVRALVETGALAGTRGAYRFTGAHHDLQLPATAQAILAARIDRLPADDKRLLQAAAVIGKDLPFVLLHAIAEQPEEAFLQSLGRLQSAEFLFETQLFPDIEYAFRHALSHEVALSGLLQDRRRALHGRILDSMERLYDKRLGEHTERLAHHAWRGEVWAKAVHYLRQAGNKASGRSATADARLWFEQALEALAHLPQTPQALDEAFGIYLELRPVLVSLAEIRASLDRAREAQAIASRLGDDHRVCKVYATMTSSQALLGELDAALASGRRALEIAERLRDQRLVILSTSVLLQTHLYRGDYERAVELARGNLARLPEDWTYEYFDNIAPASIFDRVLQVMALAELGRFDEAAPMQAEVAHLAESTQHALSISIARRAGGTLHLLRGEWALAAKWLEAWSAALEVGGIRLQMPVAYGSIAWALAQLGQHAAAREQLAKGEAQAQALVAEGNQGFMGLAYFTMGRAALALGQLDEARRWAHLVFESSPQHLGYAAHARQLLGDIACQTGALDVEGGLAQYAQALALAEPRNALPVVAHARRGMAVLLAHAGRTAEAEVARAQAVALYRQMRMDFWLDQVEAEQS